MIDYMSVDTQAIVLLTVRLGSADNMESATHAEYNTVARALHENSLRPGDLLGDGTDSQSFQAVGEILGRDRLKALLSRTLLLATEVSRWQALGIWVVSRADGEYPHLLKKKLGGATPAVFFGAGDRDPLSRAGFAVVGSRDIDQDGMDFAERLGERIAKEGHSVVSGGARGSDRAAMNGAIDAGGTAIGFLGDGLERAVSSGENRTLIEAGRLTLLTHAAPSATFTVWRAMERNKFIYAQSFAAAVVESDYAKGGTWEGAKEQLKRLHLCPIFIRESDPLSAGRAALEKLGARRLGQLAEVDLESLRGQSSLGEPTTAPSTSLQLTLDF